MRTTGIARAALAMAVLCACAPVLAAGGHHAVDDATILSRGDCEQETWASRARGGEQVLHAGASCRVGPVELGGAVEYARGGGEASATAWSLEVKWAREIADGLHVGLDLQPTWAAHQSPRHAATQFTALATWSPTPAIALHLNAGGDYLHGARDLPRGGVAIDWAPASRWSLVLERFLDTETHFVRTGARWAAGRLWGVDLSYAHRLSGPIPSYWTLGVTIDLDDD